MPFRWTSVLLGLVLLLPGAARAADEVVRPFNGSDLSGWKYRGNKAASKWVVGRAALDPRDPRKLAVTPLSPAASGGPGVRELVNAERGVDLYTERKFGDCTVELEFMVPRGSNSGVYLMGEYEVQILDSYGKKDKDLKYGDVGGIYNTAAPKVNAARKPGEWQKFVIEFRAPRFKGGKKVANAKFLKVTLNGTLLHEGVEVKGPTTSALTGKESAAGPLLLQGDHGPVAFRNLVVTPRAAKE
jgi:hypothetical protein